MDIPTRSDVTQRMIVLSPPESKAAVILFAGGHGALQVFAFRQRPDHGKNRGGPCEAFAYHGFNGLEREVVQQIAAWILAKSWPRANLP